MSRHNLPWYKSCKINVTRKIVLNIDFIHKGVSFCMLNDTLLNVKSQL